ncbi:MAG TPA: hypothetical protein VFK24_04680 [Gammaproteobacteria bacterium]|nr:hypothetical protein [Gammaproteobacteria bacterium]
MLLRVPILLLLTTLASSALADNASLEVGARLTANDAVESLLFGSRVALDDHIAVIGAAGSLASGAREPATYVFYRDSMGAWMQHQELPKGGAFSLQNDVLLIGDTVFVRNNAGDFVEQARLRPADGGGDSFGETVALFGNGKRAAVAAPFATVAGRQFAGAVYIFDRGSDGRWTQTAKLSAPPSATAENFGMALAGDGNTLVIGAPIAEADAAAAAYIFFDGVAGWTLQRTVSGAGGTGWSVALDGDTALIGTDGGGPVYVYVRGNTDAWKRQATLTPPQGASGEFGYAVAVNGNQALIGFPPPQATFETFDGSSVAPPNPGSVLLYTRNASGDWSETATAGPFEESQNLGTVVALDDGVVLTADAQAEAKGYDAAGVAYILYTPEKAATVPALNNSGGGAFGLAAALLALPALLLRKRRNLHS